ncbi:MAG: ATP-binding protein, partial [Acidimicrobiales bacterium]
MPRHVSSPVLLGRDEDLVIADEVLAAAAAGDSQWLLIGGDAGIGKSRLREEVVRRAAASGFLTLCGSCLDLAEGTPPFAPIADAVRGLRRAAGDDAVVRALGDLADDLAPLVPGAAVGSGTTAVSSGRVYEAVLELLEGLADSTPVLLTIEDAHWADQATRDLLAFLSRTLGQSRVAILMTFRTDELNRRHPLPALLAELERQPRVVRTDLRPLDHEEVRQQLAAIQESPVEPELVESIWRRSEGNPFYAEELLIADACCDRVPSSVREGTLARVAALAEQHQQVLRVAAAAGRQIDDALLAELTDLPPGELDPIVRDLIGASLLVLDGDGYRFRHALLQEVVYDELLPGERVRLHVRVAEHLLAHGATGGCEAAELAHHWSRAKRPAEALAASVDAGLAADAAGAPADALAHYERALELWDSVPDAAERSALSHLDLVERASNDAMNAGRFDRGIALIRSAAEEASDDPPRAALLHQRLGRELFVADQPGAVEAFEQGVALVPEEPQSVERAAVLAGFAQVLMLTGNLVEAIATSRRSLEVALAVGSRHWESHARNTLGTALSNQGDDRGLIELEAALAIAEEVDDPELIGRAHVNLSFALGEAGHWDELLTRGMEGLAVTRRLGIDRTHGVWLETNLIHGLTAVGRWDDAVAAQRSLAARLPTGYWEYFTIAGITADRGDVDAIRTAVDRTGALPEHDTAVLQGLTDYLEAQVATAVYEGRTVEQRALVDGLLDRVPAGMLAWQTGPVLWRALWGEADAGAAARARRDDDALSDARRTAERRLELLYAIGDPPPGSGGARPTVGIEAYVALAEAERRRLEGNDPADAWLAAAGRFDDFGFVFPAAYARFRAAEALVRDGDRAAAAPLAEAAVATACELGARPLQTL